MFSCQKEQFSEVDNQEDSSFLLDEQLTGMIKSVASHDGEFDDRIDNASCFSIEFPYGLWVDGVMHNMSSPENFAEINPTAQVMPEFPITVMAGDYSEFIINSENEFNQFIIDCHSGVLYNDIVTCVDFTYPVTISLYDSENSNFETLTLNHDWDTFSTIESLDPNRLAAINYPVTLRLNNGTPITVTSDDNLRNEIFRIVAYCN
jgi:hypothetical protein